MKNGLPLTLLSVGALAAAGLARSPAPRSPAPRSRPRGSRDAGEPEPLYTLRASMERVLGDLPEGKQPMSRWRDLFLSRGVVAEQLDTRGFLAWLSERQRQGVKSVSKDEVRAWLAANPYGLLETWKGTFGLQTDAEKRAERERAEAMNEAKRLLVAHGVGSAEADLLLACEGALAASVEGEIIRWDRILPHADQVISVAFSPDGRILATGSYDTTVTLWRVADGAKIATLPHAGSVTSVAFSPDGRVLATGSATATLWRVADRAKIATLPSAGSVTSVAFSPDGRVLATGAGDETATLWRVANGKKIATLPHAQTVTSVAFSPDGRVLATGAGDEMAYLWRVADGKKIATLPLAGWVSSVAFSPDGRVLATGSDDNTATLWRVADSAKIATLSHAKEVFSVAFSPDGRILATGGEGGWANLWRFVSDPLAQALLHRPSRREVKWSAYLSEGYDGARELLLRLPPRPGIPSFAGIGMRSHWVEPDVLVHARLTLRPIKGKKGRALFADEIQSDWQQGLAGRKPGVRAQTLPPAPFADEWEKLMIKRLLLYAAEIGVDALVLTDGATIAPLVDPSKEHHAGISSFYDEKLVRLFGALVRSLGGDVEPISVKVGSRYKALPGVRMTDALRSRLGQGMGYWGRA